MNKIEKFGLSILIISLFAFDINSMSRTISFESLGIVIFMLLFLFGDLYK